MSTQTDTEQGKQLPKHLEVFSEPRTYPAQWDVSGLSKPGHKQNDEAQPDCSPGNPGNPGSFLFRLATWRTT
jgi:hypothetical protein